MHTSLFVCIHLCNTSLFVFIHLFNSSLFICIHLFSYAYVSFKRLFSFSYIKRGLTSWIKTSFKRLFPFTYISFHVHTSLFRYIHLFSDTYISFHLHTFLFRYIHLFSDTYISFQIHTPLLNVSFHMHTSLFRYIHLFSDTYTSFMRLFPCAYTPPPPHICSHVYIRTSLKSSKGLASWNKVSFARFFSYAYTSFHMHTPLYTSLFICIHDNVKEGLFNTSLCKSIHLFSYCVMHVRQDDHKELQASHVEKELPGSDVSFHFYTSLFICIHLFSYRTTSKNSKHLMLCKRPRRKSEN